MCPLRRTGGGFRDVRLRTTVARGARRGRGLHFGGRGSQGGGARGTVALRRQISGNRSAINDGSLNFAAVLAVLRACLVDFFPGIDTSESAGRLNCYQSGLGLRTMSKAGWLPRPWFAKRFAPRTGQKPGWRAPDDDLPPTCIGTVRVGSFRPSCHQGKCIFRPRRPASSKFS